MTFRLATSLRLAAFALFTIALACSRAPGSAVTRISITDALGRRIDLAGPPSRIAVVGRDARLITSVIYQFPQSLTRLVATGGASQDPSEFGRIVDPRFSTRTVLGPVAGPEHVAATHPDLVLMGIFNIPMRRSLEALGIKVVILQPETSPGEFFQGIDLMGALFEDRERARTVRAWYQKRIDLIERQVQRNRRPRPRVLLLMHTLRDGVSAFNVPAADWMQTRLVRIAGAEPIWEAAAPGLIKTKVGIEQIAAWDPDWIFVTSYSGGEQELLGQLAADRQWQLLRATKNRQIRALPPFGYRWDQPDARWILGLEWLARELDPAGFASLDLAVETQAFFADLYRLERQP